MLSCLMFAICKLPLILLSSDLLQHEHLVGKYPLIKSTQSQMMSHKHAITAGVFHGGDKNKRLSGKLSATAICESLVHHNFVVVHARHQEWNAQSTWRVILNKSGLFVPWITMNDCTSISNTWKCALLSLKCIVLF